MINFNKRNLSVSFQTIKNDLSIDQIDIVYNNQNNKIKEANEDLKNL